MAAQLIRTLFASKIDRPIEEVIKVDQTDEDIVSEEVDEYIVTDTIRKHFVEIFEKYQDAPKRPTDNIAVWVSGFFGSGKSSFAKMLGLAISNRMLGTVPAATRFAARAGDKKLEVVLKTITERIPTHAVIFDVSTERGIRSGNQTLTEIMYGLLLHSLGYAKNLDLSELEIALEERKQLAAFEEAYRKTFKKEWNQQKGVIAFALSEASRVMHILEPATYPSADSWVKAAKEKADISAGKLAERANELMERRRKGQSLLFVVDEVGQFVARDIQKMLDLQAIAQQLGVKGRGKHWVVVTSQEKLSELVSGLDDKKIELARLMERFSSQVHLEPSDISEVTSRRVLAKNAAAQADLGKRFKEHEHRLAEHIRISADIKLPELARDAFIDLYPLLPYQIDLIIQVVSGLRTRGGAAKHVGGANRTIIKLAQQLLINPAVDLASQPIGPLVRLDHVYDLVEGNIASEIRAKISGIRKTIDHPLAQAVAKAICLLQYVGIVHRTAENLAATLHPAIDAESQLPQVKDALRALETARLIRHGDGGYRIPTPAEDDWEDARTRLLPKPSDTNRLYQEVLSGFWQPKPSHTLFDTRPFKAGLSVSGRQPIEDGDLIFQIHLADDANAAEALARELRARSEQERNDVFWVVALTNAIDAETIEVFRSKEMLARKEREARTDDETRLIGEEKVRLGTHQAELRRLLRIACLGGSAYFRKNDRSPEGATDVGKAASNILAQVLPDVFERFKEAAAKAADAKKGADALCVAENLQGLPSVFAQLGLLRDEKGKTVFRTDAGPLAHVLRLIEDRASYGEAANGKYLTTELEKEPFGWDFEIVRLLLLALLRAGKIEATSKGQTFDSATSPEAKEAFGTNNYFRATSFRPKRGVEFAQIVQAASAFQDTFGGEVKELTAPAVVNALRDQLIDRHESLTEALSALRFHQLPGTEILETAEDDLRAMLKGPDATTIRAFIGCHKALKDGLKRAAELLTALTPTRIEEIRRARHVLGAFWPLLETEPDLPDETRTRAAALRDVLARETFYKDLPALDQAARHLEAAYRTREAVAMADCEHAYDAALTNLKGHASWAAISEAQQEHVQRHLVAGRVSAKTNVAVPQLRATTEACGARLGAAIAELHRIVDGERLASVSVASYFAGGVETMEQLEAALDGIRETCAPLIVAGKKVIAG